MAAVVADGRIDDCGLTGDHNGSARQSICRSLICILNFATVSNKHLIARRLLFFENSISSRLSLQAGDCCVFLVFCAHWSTEII